MAPVPVPVGAYMAAPSPAKTRDTGASVNVGAIAIARFASEDAQSCQYQPLARLAAGDGGNRRRQQHKAIAYSVVSWPAMATSTPKRRLDPFALNRCSTFCCQPTTGAGQIAGAENKNVLLVLRTNIIRTDL